MTEKQEAQTKDERAMSRKPDGILIKKIRGLYSWRKSRI